jgi:hypothetical protein
VFDLEEILKAETDSTMCAVRKTHPKLYAMYENNFVLLPCGEKVIGVDGEDSNNLILVDISQEPATQSYPIGRHKCTITNVLYFAEWQTLLTGDGYGHVVQYEVHPSKKSFQLTRDFGKIGVGDIKSCCQFLHLAVFGGYGGDRRVGVVDVRRGRVVERPATAVGDVQSLEVCRVSGSKVYLTAFGLEADYSQKKSDVVELNQTYFRDHPQEFVHYMYSKMVTTSFETKEEDKLVRKLQKQVDTIPGLKEKIIDLEAKVQDLTNKLNEKSNRDILVNAMKMELSKEKEKFKEKVNKWENKLKRDKKKAIMMYINFEEQIRRDIYKEFERKIKEKNENGEIKDEKESRGGSRGMGESSIRETNLCGQCEDNIRKYRNLKVTNVNYFQDTLELENKLGQVKTLVQQK